VSSGSIARAAAIVAVFGVLSRVLGFLREAVLSRAFGTSGAGGAQADAFVNSLFFVNTLAAMLLYALVTIVIPGFEQERKDRDDASAWRLLWAIGAWVTIVMCTISAITALWPGAITALFGLGPVRAALMEHLLQIMAAGLALQGLSALFTAVLQSQRKYVGPAAVGVAFNLGIILGLAVGGRTIEAAAWGVVVGALAQVVLQLPQLVGVLRHVPGRPTLHHPRLKAVGVLAMPVLGASLLQQVNGYTDKLFANSLEAGRTAALNYANAAGSAPRTVLLLPLLTPFFPVISRMVAQRRDDEALSVFHRAAGVLALVSVPIGAFLMLYSTELSSVLFGGRKCGDSCVADIAGPLRFYGLGVWGAFLGYLLNRTLSAANRAHEIMVATIITVAVTIGLDLILLGPMEQSGLALATSIGIYVNTALTAWMLARRMPGLSLSLLANRQVRLVVCGVLATAATLALDSVVSSADRPAGATIALILAKGMVGLAVYVVALRIAAPAELAEGRRAARSIFRRSKPA